VILFVYSRPSQFVDLDREVLSALGPVLDWPARPSLRWALRTVRAVRRSSLVFGWFAGWHTLVPAVFARLLGRPFVLVSGGFDVASVPEIGYGSQRGSWRALLARVVLRLATRIVVNSAFSAGELAANTGVSGERVVVVHHGIPDPFGSLPGVPREPVVVTAGVVDASNLSRKGLETFVAAAALVPSAQWVVIGRWEGDAVARLEALAGPNVSLTGWVTRAELDARLASASVYVQASRHEGFGMSVAEAMLAGCIPVVTPAGALPEVVGDAGIVVGGFDAGAIAEGVERALVSDDAWRAAARARVVERFPMARRAAELAAVLAGASRGSGRAGAPPGSGTGRAAR